MTVAATITSVQFPCNGTTRQFSFLNKIFQASDLVVTLIDPSLNQYPFINQANAGLGLSYTVQNVDVDSGCLLVFNTPPNLNWTLDVRTEIPETQSTSIKNQGAFLPELHEEAFDRLTRLIQDLYRQGVLYSVHAQDIEATPWPAMPLPQNRLGMAMMFDPVTGLPTVGVPSTQTITAGLILSLLTANSIGSVFYATTAAEVAAAVTPVNFQYPPGNVDRYGTNAIPGTTDMTAAVQAAFNVARHSNGVVLVGSSGPCLLTAPIDCTTPSTAVTVPSWRVVNVGTMFPQPPPGSGGASNFGVFHAKHTGYAVFDCAGSYRISWEGVTVSTDNVTYPKTCWFLARSNAGVNGNSMYHNFRETFVVGYFSVAVLYNYGFEDGDYVANHWYNQAGDAGCNVVVITANNFYRGSANFITSSFITIHTGVASCIGHNFVGGEYALTNTSATSANFYLEGTVESFRFYGGWVANTPPSGLTTGFAFIQNDCTNGAAARCTISGLRSENAVTQPGYGIAFSPAPNPVSTAYWSVTGSYFNTSTNALASANTNVTASAFSFAGIWEAAGKGINWPGVITDSSFDWSTAMVIGTFQRSYVRNFLTNLTITTNTGSAIQDQGTGSFYAKSSLGMAGATAASQQTGWGTATAGAVVNNFPGSGATLSQCGQALTQIINQLKALGLFGA